MTGYATQADLAAFAPASLKAAVPQDPEATRLLTRASELVDVALLTARYNVDDQGMPTDTTLAGVLRDATCAQALYWLQSGDEIGAADQWSQMAIGSLTLSRGSRDTGGVGPTLCPQAVTILRGAALPSTVIRWQGLGTDWS